MRDDWIPALDVHLAAFREREFKYGETDCVLFVLAWLKVATGKDHLDGVSAWASLADGQAVLKTLGFADWTAAIDSILVRHEHPVRARMGDVVSHRDTTALGICLGVRCAFVGPEGVSVVPRTLCGIAWRVEPCPS